MFVRVNNLTGATDIDAAVALVREKVVPALRDQKGYRGVTVSGNAESGEVGVLTMWDSLADLEASESAVAHLRDETVAAAGGSVTVTKMEQVITEVGSQPPAEGCSLRIVEVTMDPSKVDEQIAWFRENVLPQLKGSAGFRLVRLMADREAGRFLVGSVWSDDATMHAGDAAAEERRGAAKERGVEVSEPRFRKLLLSQIS